MLGPRNLLFFLVLLAAIFVPYFLSQQGKIAEDEAGPGFVAKLRDAWFPSEESDDAAEFSRSDDLEAKRTRRVARSGSDLDLSAFDAASNDPFTGLESSGGRPLELPAFGGPPVQSVNELIRFDATPQWVRANWKQISTQLYELDFRGMRVPVITGTNPHDVVGSLTYYFDGQQTVQRIELHGFTSDYQSTVSRIAQQHGLTETPSLVNGLFVGRDKGSVNSILRVQNARHSRGSKRNRYEIMLELNRSGQELSEASRQMIEDGREANLW